MSSLDFDLDTRMNGLELEWRRVYEASIIARERLDRAEAEKARIMAKLERLEDIIIAQYGMKSDGETHDRPLPGW
jgi:hypothetical protein